MFREPRWSCERNLPDSESGWRSLLSAPAVFPRESEEEYWRFLPARWLRLLSSFSTVEVVPEGNSLVGFIRTDKWCLSIIRQARPARQALTL